MEKYGYLSTRPRSAAVRTQSTVESALRRLQRFNGLEVTGVLDAPTKRLLIQKRCGLSDHQTEEDLLHIHDHGMRRRRRQAQSTLTRSKRYVLAQNKWSSNEITFRYFLFYLHPKDAASHEVFLNC